MRLRILSIFLSVLLMVTLLSISTAYAGSVTTRQLGKGIKLGGIAKTLTILPMAMEDPDNPFITIYFTHVKAGRLSFSDPSNSSVSVRLTGPIPVKNGKQQVDTITTIELFKARKSVLSKKLRIARFYDPNKNTLVYITYSRKLLDGSAKHSLSVIHLGK